MGKISNSQQKDLLGRLFVEKIFLKLEMKFSFQQKQIAEKDRYKTAFTVPFGQYKWNVMPFELRNDPFEFQHVMNHKLNDYSNFSQKFLFIQKGWRNISSI